MRGRKRRLLPLLTVLVVLVAACGGETTTTTTTTAPAATTSPTADSTTTTAPEPTTLSLGMGLFPPSGVPWTGAGSPGQYVWAQVYDALTYVGPDGTIEPALATSWTSVDPTTWEFTLREGVTFANGEPFNADAVVATFDIVLSEEGRATYASNVNNYGFVSSVEAAGEFTVRVVTSTSNPLTPNALALAYIVPPAAFADQGAEAFATSPLGTGPFQATSWSDQEIVLEAWSGSWRGEPSVATLRFLHLNEPAARLQALQSGQIDIAHSVIPDQIPTLEADGFGVFIGQRGSAMSLAFIANEGGPMASQQVRQALNYAVDRQAIADTLLAGTTVAAVWPVEGVNGHDPARQPYPYDADRARELLAEAGYADGFDMVAEITVGSFPADADIYEAMAGYLAEVGVNVELRQIDFAGAWLPKFNGADGADWEGQAFGLSWNAAPLMDAIRPFTFFSCGWTNEFFCDEEAEDLVNAASANLDLAERSRQLAELLDMTRDNPSALWLIATPELWAYDAAVSGFAVNNFNIRMEQVTVGG